MTPNTDPRPAGRIQRLPEILINQIAAGEVVERPASVVKELLENSLDAGARRIDILLTDGGITRIQIIDDGHGMGPEDLALCVERHATSKVRAAEDLEAIRTFGFRGEALSSIASVSELELKSRPAGSSHAWRLAMAFGEPQGELEPVGSPVGTCLTVSQLFERVPARQKFLRSAATEFSHCARVVREVALGNPQTSFFLQHQGRLVAHYSAATREHRFQEVFKPDWEPLVVRAQAEGLALEAWLSPPEASEAHGELFLYINQRPVRHRTLLQAIRNAYTHTLGESFQPTGVVHLDVRWDWVDVNVHPQKWEVRCLGQERIFSWLQATVRKALPTPEIETTPAAKEALFASAGGTKILAQVKDRYWVCEDEQGMLLVDPQRLSQKLRRDTLEEEWGRQGKLQSEPLPIPVIVRLPQEAREKLAKVLPQLFDLGFEVEAFPDGDAAVKSRPAMLAETSVAAAFLAVMKNLETARESLAHYAAPAEAQTLLPWIERFRNTDAVYRVDFSTLEHFFERN